MQEVKFIQGDIACAYGAIRAGCKFFAGYPITPASEIAETMSRELPKVGGVFIQMEDEIAAMAAIIGASTAGVKSMTATSGPGFSLKQENIGFAAMGEVPCVIVDVMRGGPSTGLPTMPSQGDITQARWGSHGDKPTVAVMPSSVEETYYETIRAFNLAEMLRTPVMVLMDEIVGHMREKVVLNDESRIEIIDRKKPDKSPEEYKSFDFSYEDDIPPLASYGEGYRHHITGLFHRDDGFPTNDPDEIKKKYDRMMRKIDKHYDKIKKYELFYMDDAEYMIVSAGITSRSAKRAVKEMREKGIKVGLFRPITIWPFPEKEIYEYGKDMKAILVPEMNYGQIVLEVERAIKGRCEVMRYNKANGEIISPYEIIRAFNIKS